VGGGGSHTLPNHVTGSGRSTWHSRRVITLRPGALLEIYFLFPNSSTPTKSIHYFCDWEDDIARFDSLWYRHNLPSCLTLQKKLLMPHQSKSSCWIFWFSKKKLLIHCKKAIRNCKSTVRTVTWWSWLDRGLASTPSQGGTGQRHMLHLCAIEIWMKTFAKLDWYWKCCEPPRYEEKGNGYEWTEVSTLYCTLVQCTWLLYFNHMYLFSYVWVIF
jgi:hypothetical protein